MATVTREMVRLFTAGAKTIYDEAFAQASGVWEILATKVESSQRTEDYTWLSELPQMREFVDERAIKSLAAYGYSIRNRKFEATIGVEREVLEDEQYGQVKMRVRSMAEAASAHFDQLLFALIASGESALCYDGKPFYTTEHTVAGSNVSNLTDAPLTAANLEAALTQMARVPLENGEPMLVRPTHLLVPPELRFTAKRILSSAFYPDAAGANKPGAQSANVLENELQIITSARITSPTEWHIFDIGRGVKPFIVQQRVAPEFTALDGADGCESETSFLRDVYLYGVRSRGNAGFGLWQMAYKSTGLGE